MSLGWKIRIGAVASLGLLGVAAVAAPVRAEGLDHPDCAPRYVCVWSGQNFTGDLYAGYIGGACLNGLPNGGGWSMANQMNQDVMAFEFIDCTGQNFTLESGYDTANAPFPIRAVLT